MDEEFPVDVEVTPEDDRLYEGLARQNLEFHQALAELIDNSISAAEDSFTIEIALEKNGDKVEVTVSDDATGMSISELREHVLRLGGRGDDPGKLNEHGFGLKNALCVLTENERDFQIITRDEEANNENLTYKVEGPFRQDMKAEKASESEWKKNVSKSSSDTGTRVRAITTYNKFNSLYPAGGRFGYLVERLLEHLGVIYRGYLEDYENEIFVKYRDITDEETEWQDEHRVQPIRMEDILKESNKKQVEFRHEGEDYEVEYIHGERDEEVIEDSSQGPAFPLKIYYKGNQATQGVDIRVRGKVLLPHQLEEIWPDMVRHTTLNHFVGELRLESDDFRTVNNKTGMDKQNPLWQRLIEEMEDYQPERNSYTMEEDSINEEIKETLENTHPDSEADDHHPTWEGAGVEIDLVLTRDSGDKIIYELKNRNARPLDVYQLLMYWDGKVKAGVTPSYGYLIARDASNAVKNMIDYLNDQTDANGDEYSLKFRKISDIL